MIKSFCKSSYIVWCIILTSNSYGQRQDRIWLFPDSAGIDFNDPSNPISINCNLVPPAGYSSSISDNQGNLLFYTGGIDLTYKPMRIFDKNGDIMQNGDSMKGYPWVGQGNMILPMPGDTNKYYVFIAGRDGSIGNSLYYSIVDMSLNNGFGSVILRDSLFLSDHINEKLNATKHANGRDCWIVVQSNHQDSLFHKFLITPDSIFGPIDQKIGSGDNINKAFGQMIFSSDGSKLGVVAENATVDIFDFDRCSGVLTNYKAAGEGVFSYPNVYFGCSFSPSGNLFYTSSIWYEYKNVYQYDLTAGNIKATKQIIFSYPDTGLVQNLELGQHLLAPDNKIYIAKGKGFDGFNWNTYYTHHMDVITSPDSVGLSCNYQPAYLDLGAGKTVQGLPTMVNYNLGPVTGSICDSLSIGIKAIDPPKLFSLFPNPFTDEITLHSSSQLNGNMIIRNEIGQVLFKTTIKENKTFNLSFLTAGIYLVQVEIAGKIYNERLVKMKK